MIFPVLVFTLSGAYSGGGEARGRCPPQNLIKNGAVPEVIKNGKLAKKYLIFQILYLFITRREGVVQKGSDRGYTRPLPPNLLDLSSPQPDF